jgi:hypothetical protein
MPEWAATLLAEIQSIKSRLPPWRATPASEADLDGQWGDRQIRKDPPRWDGESFQGRTMSECPVAYLRALSEFLTWQADKDEQKGDASKLKYVGYARKDACLALGWAKRKEAGWKPKHSPAPDPADAPADGEGW